METSGKNNRSILLPGESFNDAMDALNNANSPEERRHIASERMRANGWDKDKEIRFREHCATCNFVLPGSQPPPSPLAKDSAGRQNARLLAEAASNDFRQSKLTGEMEE